MHVNTRTAEQLRASYSHIQLYSHVYLARVIVVSSGVSNCSSISTQIAQESQVFQSPHPAVVRQTIFYCTTHSLHFLSLLLYIELPVVCTQFSTSYVSGLAITSIYASLLNVLCRLGENYEMVQGSCLPRSVLYTHYQDFCKKNQMEASSAASFGKVAQQPPPHTHTPTLSPSPSLLPSLSLSLSFSHSLSLSLSHTHTHTHTHNTHNLAACNTSNMRFPMFTRSFV